MAGMDPNCLICETEKTLTTRAAEIRRELLKMDPARDPNYDGLFKVLIDVDLDRQMLKGRRRGDRADA